MRRSILEEARRAGHGGGFARGGQARARRCRRTPQHQEGLPGGDALELRPDGEEQLIEVRRAAEGHDILVACGHVRADARLLDDDLQILAPVEALAVQHRGFHQVDATAIGREQRHDAEPLQHRDAQRWRAPFLAAAADGRPRQGERER